MVNSNWDKLSEFFNIRIADGEIQGGSMDNILIGWPPILKAIQRNFSSTKGKYALDYGCGTGEFCFKLNELGFSVTGIDSSKKMITKARQYLPKQVKTIVGELNKVEKQRFDLITSIQVFQFIENIESLIAGFDKLLNHDGLIVFATFNIDFVKNCIRDNVLLVDFDSNKNPKNGWFMLGENIRIPVFVRTAKEYKEYFSRLGYDCLLEEYPPFTKEFLEKYPLKVSENQVAPSENPEFMILAFVKEV